MNRWLLCFVLVIAGVLAVPYRCPAPLIYCPGEGWSYEQAGQVGWHKGKAKDQLEMAQASFDRGNYYLALKAAGRTVKQWPLSDYAPRAQYLVGRCREALRQDEKAFAAYQTLLDKYPKIENYQEVLRRQLDIANRFLAGQFFRFLGYIPLYISRDKTVEMYEKVIHNGPYNEVAPQAQMNIGAAREKQKEFPKAAKAYELAADMYHYQKQFAAGALFKVGEAYHRQALRAEYDQSAAGKSIAAFADFIALYPNDPRVAEAQTTMTSLKTDQARGSLSVAHYYEKRKRWNGALIYYNEVLVKDPNSAYAGEAKQRMDELKQRPAASKTAAN